MAHLYQGFQEEDQMEVGEPFARRLSWMRRCHGVMELVSGGLFASFIVITLPV